MTTPTRPACVKDVHREVDTAPLIPGRRRIDDRGGGHGGGEALGDVLPAAGGAPDKIRSADVGAPRHQQLLRREARDHVAAGRGHDHLLLDPRRGPPVGRCAIGLEREHHPLFELDRRVERMDARDHRRLVEADADSVSELEAEARLLVGESELLGGGPDLGDPVRRHAGPDEGDRRVEPLAALLVRVELSGADAADVERAVVARSVAHERVDDVEERLVARPQEPVGEDVRVGVAAIAGDGVHRLDLLGSHLEEQLVRARDDLVLVHARPQHPVDLVVDRVDETGGLVEERDLLRRLDLARVEERLRAVGDVETGPLQRLDRDEVGHVHTERLALEAELTQLVRDLLPEPVRDARLDGHRSAHRCDTGPKAPRAATARRAGDGGPPSRSPTGSGPRRARAA